MPSNTTPFSSDTTLTTLLDRSFWDKAVAFHGHECPGLAIGYKACEAVIAEFNLDAQTLPAIDEEKKCTGCGLCVASCSGQAIFLVDETYEEGYASIAFPYEFLPMPKIGDKGTALDRQGKPVCEAEIVGVKRAPIMDKTAVVTMKVPIAFVKTARFYRPLV